MIVVTHYSSVLRRIYQLLRLSLLLAANVKSLRMQIFRLKIVFFLVLEHHTTIKLIGIWLRIKIH